MKISIITIAYNSESTIEETILSVINQQNVDLEYILVDGGSKDRTLSIINRYKDHFSTVISEPDDGIYHAMNKGIELAKGEIVGMLNSDDIYAYTDFLADVVDLFRDTAISGVYADLEYVRKEDITKVVRTWKSGHYKDNNFLEGWMPPHPAFFVRRLCYEKFGFFNTLLTSAADYELMLRFIHKNKIKLAYLPKTGVKMRIGGQSNVSITNRLKAHYEDRLAWKLNDIRPKWYTFYAKPFRKIGQYFMRER